MPLRSELDFWWLACKLQLKNSEKVFWFFGVFFVCVVMPKLMSLEREKKKNLFSVAELSLSSTRAASGKTGCQSSAGDTGDVTDQTQVLCLAEIS